MSNSFVDVKVVAGHPSASHNRGMHVLNALQSLGPIIHPAVPDMWDGVVPKLCQHLRGCHSVLTLVVYTGYWWWRASIEGPAHLHLVSGWFSLVMAFKKACAIYPSICIWVHNWGGTWKTAITVEVVLVVVCKHSCPWVWFVSMKWIHHCHAILLRLLSIYYFSNSDFYAWICCNI